LKKKIAIEGMSCGHCSGRVTKALKELEGVLEATVDLKDKSALIEMTKEISDQVLRDTIDDAGYDVIAIELA